MDFSASPDLNAFYCYFIVFSVGLITATIQINKRLENFAGKWVMLQTWLLLSAYTVLPVALFWFLDRVNAIHDTSLFAALVIGAGYQQVLSGNLATIRAGDVSKIWQPFTAWADHIGDRIRDRISANAELFDERLRSLVLGDPAKQEALHFLAVTHEKDPVTLQQQLTAIQGQEEVLGPAGVRLKQIGALYDSLRNSSPRSFQFLLSTKGVTSPFTYYWYGKEWRSKTTALVVALIICALMLWGVFAFTRTATPGRYYEWRLRKENTTDLDRFRSKKKIGCYMAEDPALLKDLVSSLRYGALSAKSTDNVFELILESRNSPAVSFRDTALVPLSDALRTDNPSTRARIQETLFYLAKDKHAEVPAELKDWKPSQKDTLSDIDQRVKEWGSVVWQDEPVAKSGPHEKCQFF